MVKSEDCLFIIHGVYRTVYRIYMLEMQFDRGNVFIIMLQVFVLILFKGDHFKVVSMRFF